MQGLVAILPGGLLHKGGIEQHARFHPLNGRIEQRLIESAKYLEPSEYVTAVLSSTLDCIGNVVVDEQQVADLCVADREYLMLRLASMLDGEQVWLKVTCGFCDMPFDVEIHRCDLPVKKAGEGFPSVTLKLDDRSIKARVPTGSDQQRIAALADNEAILQLLRLCIDSVNGDKPSEDFVNSLSDSDIEAIDTALEEVSPAVCDKLLVNCPECGRQQHAELDHYHLTGMEERFLYNEVHTLASYYHWSEAAILDLPQSRRRLYLSLISRSSGMVE